LHIGVQTKGHVHRSRVRPKSRIEHTFDYSH
jgi:hypothetical protein